MSNYNQPFLINVKKDDFTGIKSISTSFIGLKSFQSFGLGNAFYFELATMQKEMISLDLRQIKAEIQIHGQAQAATLRRLEETKNFDFSVFNLFYGELESGQGLMTLGVLSYKTDDYFSLDQSLPLIIDGERLMLNAENSATIEISHEFMAYKLPVDIFHKICYGNEVRFRVSGKGQNIEGVFPKHIIQMFKAFEQNCFGDEAQGKSLLEEINKTAVVESANLSSSNQPSLTSEEIEKCQKDVVKLIFEEKVVDAFSLVENIYKCSHEDAKKIVKGIATKHSNKTHNIYKKYENQYNLGIGVGCLVIVIILFLFFKACS